MTQGWHGDSRGHARAGRLGGRKSAENRRARTRASAFGEQMPLGYEQLKPDSRSTKARPNSDR